MATGSLHTRLRAKFSRRNSVTPSVASSNDADFALNVSSRSRSIAQSIRSLRSRGPTRPSSSIEPEAADLPTNAAILERTSQTPEKSTSRTPKNRPPSAFNSYKKRMLKTGVATSHVDASEDEAQAMSVASELKDQEVDGQPKTQAKHGSFLSNDVVAATARSKHLEVADNNERYSSTSTAADLPTPGSDIGAHTDVHDKAEEASTTSSRQPLLQRQQSLLPNQQTRLIKTLLDTDIPPPSRAGRLDYFQYNGPSTISANMVTRKIWVKRPQASATLVQINEDDLVDDVRDMILKKYANSLGRTFDAPDVTLRIYSRDHKQERIMGPDEPMSRTIDSYFPGGQTVDEALVIDVPTRRTPRPSPRAQPMYQYNDELRPIEAGTDYFPPMPVPHASSPHLMPGIPATHSQPQQHAISVLATGHVPPLPSPGGARRGFARPRTTRTHTSSPTVPITNGTNPSMARSTRTRAHSNASDQSSAPPAPPPLPTPPATDIQRTSTPPPRVASPRPGKAKKSKKNADHPNLPAGMLNGSVPPINVLIVEDNIINLKLLEAFMKRLKVRWQTAMDGKQAVTKWRAGGFHLVLMDIQLPVMNGLDATREIRRLEKMNHIGVFSSSASSKAPEQSKEPEGDDKLPSTVLFKSPVIIVALTASSLQSDRHEALAAGCNDFLTKPVNFVWLERKVMEWGCMQALIDFDGWRKWKDFSEKSTDENANSSGGSASLLRKKKNRNSVGGGSSLGAAASSAVTRISEEVEGS